jgi:hypothetical protein
MHGINRSIEDYLSFASRVGQWSEASRTRWEQAPTDLPDFLPRFSLEQQNKRRRELDAVLARLPDSQEDVEAMPAGERARIRARIRAWIARSLSPSWSGETDKFFSGCEDVADIFVHRAREFDGSLPDNDIHQALRNQWVFNSIQAFCGVPVSLTPSSFAYSMLYPLTDNFLDAPGRSREERAAFVRWLSARLSGDPVSHETEQWAQIGRLLDMIDEEFPDGRFPAVRQSVRAIHEAQKEALELHAGGTASDDCKLMLTLTKGGTSVLADGYLVSGALERRQAESVFGYGVALQLIDDLQDLEEDCRNGHSTLFTRAGSGPGLEESTNRLLHTTRRELACLGEVSAVPWLEPLIEESCFALIFEAVARQRRHYGNEYLRQFARHVPLPLEYLGELKKNAPLLGHRSGRGRAA